MSNLVKIYLTKDSYYQHGVLPEKYQDLLETLWELCPEENQYIKLYNKDVKVPRKFI